MTSGLRLAVNTFRNRITLLHELSEMYKPAIPRTKTKLMEIMREKADRAAKSELARKMNVLKGFYTLEMAPPTSAEEMKKLGHDVKLAQNFFKAGAYAHLTVKQAWLLFLVSLEIFLWFFIGETLGKGHLVGYLV